MRYERISGLLAVLSLCHLACGKGTGLSGQSQQASDKKSTKEITSPSDAGNQSTSGGSTSGGASPGSSSIDDPVITGAEPPAEIAGAYLTCGTISENTGKQCGCNVVMSNGDKVQKYGYSAIFDVTTPTGDSLTYATPSNQDAKWDFVATIGSADVPTARIAAAVSKDAYTNAFRMPAAKVSTTPNGPDSNFALPTRVAGRYVTSLSTIAGVGTNSLASMALLGQFDLAGAVDFDWQNGTFAASGLTQNVSTAFLLPLSIGLSDGSTAQRTVEFHFIKVKGNLVQASWPSSENWTPRKHLI